MSNYQRLISYIYTYEGGIKGKNIGFAKLETRGAQCRITVSVKKIFVGGNPLGVYLLSEQTDLKIGTLFARNGAGEFRATVNSQDVENSGLGMETFYGLSVHDVESAWRSYTTIWEDAVAHAAEVELADVTAENIGKKRGTGEIREEREPEDTLPISREIEAELEQEDTDSAAAEAEELRKREEEPAMIEAGSAELEAESSTAEKSVWENSAPREDVSDGALLTVETADDLQELCTRRDRKHWEQRPGGWKKIETRNLRESLMRDQTAISAAPAAPAEPQENCISEEGRQSRSENGHWRNAGSTGRAGGYNRDSEIIGNQAGSGDPGLETPWRPEGPGPEIPPRPEGPGPEIPSRPEGPGPEIPPRPEGPGPEIPSRPEGPGPEIPSQPGCPGPEIAAPQVSEMEIRTSKGPNPSAPVTAELQKLHQTQLCGRGGTGRRPQDNKGLQQSSPRPQVQPDMEEPPANCIPISREEKESYTQEEMWGMLRKKYPKVLAFDYADGCEILSVKPQDIGLLPRETWLFGNNSFLLHGYYNYRYLILARLNNQSGPPRYLLGVPGHYYSNEKYMAAMFGFPNFVLAKKQPSGDGRFGYWYTDIRVGE